jgi:IS5 family transposase
MLTSLTDRHGYFMPRRAARIDPHQIIRRGCAARGRAGARRAHFDTAPFDRSGAIWKANDGATAGVMRISPIAATVTAVLSMRPGRPKTALNPKSGPRVEHAIGVIKRVFGFAKVRYRGLKKNAHRLMVACALANLFIARRHL